MPPPVHGRQQMDKAHAKFVGRKGKVGAGPSRLPAVSHSGVSVYPRASLQKTSRSVCSQVWCAQWPAGAAARANRSGPPQVGGWREFFSEAQVRRLHNPYRSL